MCTMKDEHHSDMCGVYVLKQFDGQRATCRSPLNRSQDCLVNAYGLLPKHSEFVVRGSVHNTLNHCESLNLISYNSDSASAYPHHAKRCKLVV